MQPVIIRKGTNLSTYPERNASAYDQQILQKKHSINNINQLLTTYKAMTGKYEIWNDWSFIFKSNGSFIMFAKGAGDFQLNDLNLPLVHLLASQYYCYCRKLAEI